MEVQCDVCDQAIQPGEVYQKCPRCQCAFHMACLADLELRGLILAQKCVQCRAPWYGIDYELHLAE